MKKIISCIGNTTTSINKASIWASKKLNIDLLLLHVLNKSEFSIQSDLSGSFGVDGREHLLQKLTLLDEQRSKIALEHGQHILNKSKQYIKEHTTVNVETLQRHGNLVETLQEMEDGVELFILGKSAKYAVGSRLENTIRTSHRPILVVVGELQEPSNFMIAFDASATAQKSLDMVTSSPLLKGANCHLVMVAEDTATHQEYLATAKQQLEQAGFEVNSIILQGEVQQALNAYQAQHKIDLIVMGAYGHSHIRQLFVGSNTTRMLSMSQVSLLLLR